GRGGAPARDAAGVLPDARLGRAGRADAREAAGAGPGVGVKSRRAAMPLKNHFVPPLSVTHPWSGFHGMWATTIAQQLNGGILPANFYAIPTVELGGPVEIDVATVEDASGPPPPATQASAEPWAPPAPAGTLAVDFTGIDTIEVQVFFDEGSPRLAAAIELVSPKNKDRPSQRRAVPAQGCHHLPPAASPVVLGVGAARRHSLHPAPF